ncbi:MAG: ABC transporter ATP-binding protein [Desulfobulbaceae bacterium]|jgi:branched-chain amino acid transport system ATP-binding protein|nr:ABC transporter ATP-binding protein [Desulfobulbaceae bacterium]
MLQIKNLQAGYGKIKVLKNISMHVNGGEIVTLIGANGAGKTTLLYTIAGMIKKTGGEIVLFNRDTAKMPPQAIVKSGCCLVPEGRQVFATMSVEDNLYLGGYVQYKQQKNYDRAGELQSIYDIFPVLEERREQFAGTLSGGEQQMLAMGRALMGGPKLIMMDEPSTGLAPLIVKDIFQIIIKLREAGNTVLLIEQNAKAALGIADRGYVMETGKIIIQGPAADLLANNDVQRAYLGRDVDDINASCEI